MKLSTLLLTTTALVVAGSAYAADLPAKKGAPVKAATGCPAFGAGYWSIPGGDTCLKLSGYVNSNNTYTTDSQSRGSAPYSFSAGYGLQFDARNNTDIGAIASSILIEDTALTYASVSAAGLTAGQFDDMGDIFGLGIKGGDKAGPTSTGFNYSIPAGSSTIKLGVVSAKTNWNTTASGRPDLQLGVDTGVGPAALNLVAVSHEAPGSSSGAYNGYALLGRAVVTAGAAKITVHGGTAQGASAYISGYSFSSMTEADTTGATASTANIVGAKASVALGTGTMTVYGNNIAVTGASGSTQTLKSSVVGVNYALPVAKGLTVTPEFYTLNRDVTGTKTTSNNVYLRISRDF